MHWSVTVAIVVAAFWFVLVGRFIYITNREMAGRIGPRPPIYSTQFVVPFLIIWSVPVAICLAIWGGVFWW